jgi:hypothetical protein
MHIKAKVMSYSDDINLKNQDNMTFPGEILSVFSRM